VGKSVVKTSNGRGYCGRHWPAGSPWHQAVGVHGCCGRGHGTAMRAIGFPHSQHAESSTLIRIFSPACWRPRICRPLASNLKSFVAHVCAFATPPKRKRASAVAGRAMVAGESRHTNGENLLVSWNRIRRPCQYPLLVPLASTHIKPARTLPSPPFGPCCCRLKRGHARGCGPT
jgi:hypothetical protein